MSITAYIIYVRCVKKGKIKLSNIIYIFVLINCFAFQWISKLGNIFANTNLLFTHWLFGSLFCYWLRVRLFLKEQLNYRRIFFSLCLFLFVQHQLNYNHEIFYYFHQYSGSSYVRKVITPRE